MLIMISNILLSLLITLLLLKKLLSYSLVDNDHDYNEYENNINPYHDMSENVQYKVFLHKLNIWRKHYRNYTKDDINHNKKRFELVDTYIPSTNNINKNINIAILFRCHNPTINSIRRIQKWIKEFKKHKKSIKYSMHMSMDISAGLKPYLETKRIFEGYDISFHTYTNNNMTRAYPILIEMLKRVPPYFFDHSLSVAKGFHIEPICLWWLWVNDLKVSYDYVWTLEDDVGITGGSFHTGSLFEFVDLYDNKDWKNSKDDYENDNPDLITYGKYYTSKDDRDTYHDRWVYHDTVSNAYALLTHEREQFYTQEHVQRFSARYINLLHYYAKTHKITAWSEQSSISIITNLKPKWRVGQIAFGNIGQYEVIKRINQTKFESIQSIENNSSNTIKLWHALKW